MEFVDLFFCIGRFQDKGNQNPLKHSEGQVVNSRQSLEPTLLMDFQFKNI